MKFEFMQTHAHQFSIARMSKMLKVSRYGYYKFKSLFKCPLKQDDGNHPIMSRSSASPPVP